MAPRYPVDWLDSVRSATRYSVDMRDSVLSGSSYPVDRRTQYFWAPRYPVDWRDSVLSATQVPYGLVGLSPFGHQITLGLEDMEGHVINIYIYCVYIPWRPSTVRLVRAKCKKRGLVPTCIYLSFFFIKTICNVLNMIRVYVFNTAVYD